MALNFSNGGSTDNAASNAAAPQGSLGGYGTANCAIGGAAIKGMDYIIVSNYSTHEFTWTELSFEKFQNAIFYYQDIQNSFIG